MAIKDLCGVCSCTRARGGGGRSGAQGNDVAGFGVKNSSSEAPWRRAWSDDLEPWITADRQDEL